MQINRTHGWIILLLSFIYINIESAFFGSHFLPSCETEVIAGGLGLLITCLGFALLAFSNKSN